MNNVDGKVVIVTGAGRGIGRGEALEYARAGARVVVNDFGADVHGEHPRSETAEAVAAEITAMGGEAIANGEDIADWEGSRRLVQAAVERYGRLDVLVNNAGILRDRTVANMEIEEWDAVIRVHLRGTFAMTRHAAAYWKDRSKAGETLDVRIVNTSSGSGLYGNPGQANYGAAKAGIASLTIISSQELLRYGVKVNAIAPTALTRMTDDRPFTQEAKLLAEQDPDAYNPLAPENIAPLVVWLGSDAASEVTGRVFNVDGGRISVAEPWHVGPQVDKGDRWKVDELDTVIPGLLADARPVVTLKPVKAAS